MEPTQTFAAYKAQQLGYPARLMGYTPNDQYYWYEPDLAWASALCNPERFGLDPDTCAREQASTYVLPEVWNDNMAPRFPTGAVLAGKPATFGDCFSAGDVLLWLPPGQAPDCTSLARLVKQEAGHLLLAYDNGGHTLRLPWHELSPALYVVTCYVRQPIV